MESLGIDLKLIVVQIINFGLLLFLLTKFLYKPILKILDERRKKIADSLATAQKIEEEKTKFEERKEKELKKTKEMGLKLLEQMRLEGENQRSQTIALAQDEAERIIIRAKEQLDLEKEKLKEEIKGELAGLSLAMTKRLLGREIKNENKKEILAQSLRGLRQKSAREISLFESPISRKRRVSPPAAKIALEILNFLKKSQNLNLLPEVVGKLEESLPASAEVISASVLSPDEQKRISSTLEEVFGLKIGINFRVNPEILGGLVVRVGDRVFDNSLLGKAGQMQESL